MRSAVDQQVPHGPADKPKRVRIYESLQGHKGPSWYHNVGPVRRDPPYGAFFMAPGNRFRSVVVRLARANNYPALVEHYPQARVLI